MMINATLKDDKNYLNFLIEKLTEENYDDVSEMIKIMLLNGCNPNHPNNNSETFFYNLLLKLQEKSDKSNLIKFCLEHAVIDFHSYKGHEIISLMNSRGLGHKVTLNSEPRADLDFMMRQLDNNDEEAFIRNFDNFKRSNKKFPDDIAILMGEATARGFIKTVELIMQHSKDINVISSRGRFQLAPAELACTFGHHKVLEVLFRASNLVLKRNKAKNSLLHIVLLSQLADENDRRKCFEIIITDHRCTLEIINSANEDDLTPLSIACLNGFDEVARELLRRGAYIGRKSIVDNIGKELLKDFLDKSIKCSSYSTDKNCEVYVDYRFLMPPNVKNKTHPEMESVSLIAENDNLGDLILHPVLKTFLALKWRMIRFIVYSNLLVYFAFLVYYGAFIVSNLRHSELQNLTYKNYSFTVIELDDGSVQLDSSNWIKPYSYDFFMYGWKFHICVVGIVIIAFNELIQCLMSFRKYFTKLSNYFDMFFVVISASSLLVYLIGFSEIEEIRALTILMVAAQCIQLITRVPIFSISLHMTIFKRVCSTFLRTMSLYMILIVAFAMSFHTLHDRSSEDPEEFEYGRRIRYYENSESKELDFSDVFSAIILTVRMMVSDFDGIQLKRDKIFLGIIFVLFVILISIVLFNLLNALTISDTHNILKDAELVEAKKTVSILRSYEKRFAVLKMSCGNIFPRISSIILKPNSSNLVITCKKRSDHDSVIIQVEPTNCYGKNKNVDSFSVEGKMCTIKFSAKIMQKVREYIRG